MGLQPHVKGEARIEEMIEEGTDQFNDVEERLDKMEREQERLKRIVNILLDRNGGLTDDERIEVEA